MQIVAAVPAGDDYHIPGTKLPILGWAVGDDHRVYPITARGLMTPIRDAEGKELSSVPLTKVAG